MRLKKQLGMPFIERTRTYEGYTDNVKVLETIVVVIELFGEMSCLGKYSLRFKL